MKHFIAIPAMLIAIAAIGALPPETARIVLHEHGIVESATALAYFLAAAAVVAARPLVFRRVALAAIPLFCALRELDLHKRWTGETALRPSYWLERELPFSAVETGMAAGLAVFAFLILSAFVLYGREFILAVRKRDFAAVQLLLAVLIVIASKIVEKYDIVESCDSLCVLIFEETMELAASLMILHIAAAALIRNRK